MRKHAASLMLLSLMLVVITGESEAQKKRTTRTKSRAASTAPAVADMRPEATQISEQITLFTKFLYIYGKVANGLEVADDLAKRGQVKPEVAEQNRKSKDALVANINSLRAGLEKVVKNLQVNPRMQVQYLKLSYASEAAANAERLASAKRYDEAGQALVMAIQRMSETILAMRLM